ncbi:MAG: DUF3800 domain-containing protein [Elusimicrobia bacterium]|nr:DUF3800 domain-containing protein [Elusimicrobiota bacterium]
MKELSIFIDESGDFGGYKKHSPYYIVSLILHEQDKCIKKNVTKLNETLSGLGLKDHNIHTAPLIRREQSYKFVERQKRIKIFDCLYHFIRKVNIKYKSIATVKKSDCTTIDVTNNISKQLATFLKDNFSYFASFDRVVVYYDNGQIELTRILISVFNAIIGNAEFKKVSPFGYKLFQTADFICTLSLIELKLFNGKNLSVSEESFFGSPRKLTKKYMKYIKTIEF